jgi:hypothetical protein
MSKLWHEKLRHLNYRKLQEMITNNIVRVLKNISTWKRVCEACVLGKCHKDYFPSITIRRDIYTLQPMSCTILLLFNK